MKKLRFSKTQLRSCSHYLAFNKVRRNNSSLLHRRYPLVLAFTLIVIAEVVSQSITREHIKTIEIGKTKGAEIEKLLGTPDTIYESDASTFWNYSTSNCQLRVIFTSATKVVEDYGFYQTSARENYIDPKNIDVDQLNGMEVAELESLYGQPTEIIITGKMKDEQWFYKSKSSSLYVNIDAEVDSVVYFRYLYNSL